jgi:hypothetical protein
MKEEVAQARQAGHTQLDVVKLANFHFQYGALIREGFELNPKVPPPPGNKRMKQSLPGICWIDSTDIARKHSASYMILPWRLITTRPNAICA